MLLGLIRPTAGTARLFGRDPLVDGARPSTASPASSRAPRFYPYLSGRRNLELLAAYDGGAAATRIDEALETRRAARPREGPRRRLLARHAPAARHRRRAAARPAAAAARRADHRPRPGGHARHARRSSAGSPAEGITVLLSSHLLNEVEELCNRVAIIRTGADRLRGLARRPARDGGERLPPATTRPDARARSLLAQRGHRELDARGRRAPLHRATRTPSRRCRSRSARRASGSPRSCRDGDARGAVLRHDRRRVVRPRPPSRPSRDDRRRHGLPLGAREAARAEAHLPRARRGDRSSR